MQFAKIRTRLRSITGRRSLLTLVMPTTSPTLASFYRTCVAIPPALSLATRELYRRIQIMPTLPTIMRCGGIGVDNCLNSLTSTSTLCHKPDELFFLLGFTSPPPSFAQVLLDGPLKRHKDAEALYRRVLSNDSNHAYALYNLAILLEEGLPPSTSSSSANKELPSATAATVPKGHASAGSNEPEVLSLFERACAAAPDDALSCADLGRFLLVRKRNYNAAEASLNKALELDPHCSVALFHMGLLRADAKSQGPDRMHDLGAATLLWQRLVATDPTHVAGLRRLARLEAEHLKDWPAADKHYAQVSL